VNGTASQALRAGAPAFWQRPGVKIPRGGFVQQREQPTNQTSQTNDDERLLAFQKAWKRVRMPGAFSAHGVSPQLGDST
jgi:hypothetical protein